MVTASIYECNSSPYTFSINTNGIHILEGIYDSVVLIIAPNISVTIYDKLQTSARTIHILSHARCIYIQLDRYCIIESIDHIYAQQDSFMQLLYSGSYTHTVKRSIDIYMQERGAQVVCTMLYALSKQAHLTINTKQHHGAPHTTSTIEVRKMQADHSFSVYNGMIHIASHASYSNASQEDKTLLTSHTASAQSKPALEVCTQEVQCSHGSALGIINQDYVWYLESRGITRELAELLLKNAFFVSLLQMLDINVQKEVCQLLGIQEVE